MGFERYDSVMGTQVMLTRRHSWSTSVTTALVFDSKLMIASPGWWIAPIRTGKKASIGFLESWRVQYSARGVLSGSAWSSMYRLTGVTKQSSSDHLTI